jgi:hypothetical protein
MCMYVFVCVCTYVCCGCVVNIADSPICMAAIVQLYLHMRRVVCCVVLCCVLLGCNVCCVLCYGLRHVGVVCCVAVTSIVSASGVGTERHMRAYWIAMRIN